MEQGKAEREGRDGFRGVTHIREVPPDSLPSGGSRADDGAAGEQTGPNFL